MMTLHATTIHPMTIHRTSLKPVMTLLAVIMAVTMFQGCNPAPRTSPFISVVDGQFIRDGEPYYFIGTNYWYGPILGSKGEYGDRERLLAELDHMKAHGIENLRVLAGAEGPDGEPSRVTPTLLTAPGQYNEGLLDGLDFFLAELGKRKMTAVLFITNNWEWSGGFAQYLNWNGYGPIPYPNLEAYSWPDFMKYSAQFHECDPCKEMLNRHITFMLKRTNPYSGLAYIDDPAIMSWEIANEPRATFERFTPNLETWLSETAALIKSIDPNHMVTAGSEAINLPSFTRIHADPNMDYLTFHIWPKNWSWIHPDSIEETLESAIEKTNAYLEERVEVARSLGKPLVFEEFGLPRDHHQYTPGSPVTLRDRYYANAFEYLVAHAGENDVLAGCNFWAYGGSARPSDGRLFWQEGDAPMGDPPQEEQGLNTVFDSDPTMELIKEYSEKLKP